VPTKKETNKTTTKMMSLMVSKGVKFVILLASMDVLLMAAVANDGKIRFYF